MWLINLALLAAVQSADRPAPVALQSIRDCRRLSDAERLKCYDQAVAALDSAVASGTVAVVDKEEMRRTRRTLFGLRLPSLPLLGGPETEQASIESTIKSARPFDRGKWLLVLADGAVWQTTEADTRSMEPRPGDAVTIKRGALGSYILKWTNGRAQRAQRVS